MEVTKLGEGEAEYVVVGSVHGDEPCGKQAIKRFIESGYDLQEPVKFIIANEEALEQDKRFLDVDLNRNFPGDSESNEHEERLAAKIMKEIKGKKVLDIHTTRSYPDPFATFTEINPTTHQLLQSSGVENAVLFPEESGTLHEQTDGIVIEAGYQGTEQAIENAYYLIVNFLASEGVIEADFNRSEPDVYQYYETVEGDWNFVAENFHKVVKGDIFGKRESEEVKAQEDFYPVLMSTDGYESMLGFKARKLDSQDIESIK
jgi:predicted deacylase